MIRIQYASGVAQAEAKMARVERKDIQPWRASMVSMHDQDNFVTNRVTLASYSDALNAGSVLGIATTWACVNLLAGTIASLPLMVYRQERGARVIARDHPLYRVLHDSPNFDQSAVDFWEFTQASLELQGNAYAEIKKVGDRITSLVPIRPDLVTVRRNGGGHLEYSWTADGVAYQRRDIDMLHIRGFGGSPLGGASTLAICRRTFALAQDIDTSSAGFFSNGVRPSGILSTKDSLNGVQRAEAERVLAEKFAGAMQAGRPMLLDRDMQWEQITINPEDAQMLESRRFSVEEICRVFGVPPHMIGHTENSTSWGTGLEQQTLGFQKFTLRRRLKRIEQALEKQLLSPADKAAGVTIEFSLEGLLRGDSAARSSFYQSGLNNGWMTINEVRALENMPPVEGGDVPRMQMQNVPITQAGGPSSQGATE